MQIRTQSRTKQTDFDQIYQQVISNREPVEIYINGRESVSVILTSELNSLLETVYLFQSPENAKRLLDSLERVQKKINQSETIDNLRQKFGLEEEN